MSFKMTLTFLISSFFISLIILKINAEQCSDTPCVVANMQSCSDINGEFKCTCKPSFYGKRCSLKSLNISTCGIPCENSCPESSTAVYVSTTMGLETTTAEVNKSSTDVIMDLLASKKDTLTPEQYNALANQILQLILNSGSRRKRAVSDLAGKVFAFISNIKQVVNVNGDLVNRLTFTVESNHSSVTKETLEANIKVDKVLEATSKTFNTEVKQQVNTSRSVSNGHFMWVKNTFLDRRSYSSYASVLKKSCLKKRPNLKDRFNFDVQVLRGEEYLDEYGESVTKLFYFLNYFESQEQTTSVELSSNDIKLDDESLETDFKENNIDFVFHKGVKDFREIDSFSLYVQGVVKDIDDDLFATWLKEMYVELKSLTTVQQVIISGRKTIIYNQVESTLLIYFLKDTSGQVISATVQEPLIETEVKAKFEANSKFTAAKYSLIYTARTVAKTKSQVIREINTEEVKSKSELTLDSAFSFFLEFDIGVDVYVNIQTALQTVLNQMSEYKTDTVEIATTSSFVTEAGLSTQVYYFIKRNNLHYLDARKFASIDIDVEKISTEVSKVKTTDGSFCKVIKKTKRELRKTGKKLKKCLRKLIRGKCYKDDKLKFESSFKKSLLSFNKDVYKDASKLTCNLLNIRKVIGKDGFKYSELVFSASYDSSDIDFSYKTKSQVTSTVLQTNIDFKRNDKTVYTINDLTEDDFSFNPSDLLDVTFKTQVSKKDYSKVIEQIKATYNDVDLDVEIFTSEVIITKLNKQRRYNLKCKFSKKGKFFKKRQMKNFERGTFKQKISTVKTFLKTDFSYDDTLNIDESINYEDTTFNFLLKESISVADSKKVTASIKSSLKFDSSLIWAKDDFNITILGTVKVNSKVSLKQYSKISYMVTINDTVIDSFTNQPVKIDILSKHLSNVTTLSKIKYTLIEETTTSIGSDNNFTNSDDNSKLVIKEKLLNSDQLAIEKAVAIAISKKQTIDISRLSTIISLIEESFVLDLHISATLIEYVVYLENEEITSSLLKGTVTISEIYAEFSSDLKSRITILDKTDEQIMAVDMSMGINLNTKITDVEAKKVVEFMKAQFVLANNLEVNSLTASFVVNEEVFNTISKEMLYSIKVSMFYEDQLVDGYVESLGNFEEIKKKFEEYKVVDVRGKLVEIINIEKENVARKRETHSLIFENVVSTSDFREIENVLKKYLNGAVNSLGVQEVNILGQETIFFNETKKAAKIYFEMIDVNQETINLAIKTLDLSDISLELSKETTLLKYKLIEESVVEKMNMVMEIETFDIIFEKSPFIADLKNIEKAIELDFKSNFIAKIVDVQEHITSEGKTVFIVKLSMKNSTSKINIDFRTSNLMVQEDVKQIMSTVKRENTDLKYDSLLVSETNIKSSELSGLFKLVIDKKIDLEGETKVKMDSILKEVLDKMNTDFELENVSINVLGMKSVLENKVEKFEIMYEVKDKYGVLKHFDLPKPDIAVIQKLIDDKALTDAKGAKITISELKETSVLKESTFSLTLNKNVSMSDEMEIIKAYEAVCRKTLNISNSVDLKVKLEKVTEEISQLVKTQFTYSISIHKENELVSSKLYSLSPDHIKDVLKEVKITGSKSSIASAILEISTDIDHTENIKTSSITNYEETSSLTITDNLKLSDISAVEKIIKDTITTLNPSLAGKNVSVKIIDQEIVLDDVTKEEINKVIYQVKVNGEAIGDSLLKNIKSELQGELKLKKNIDVKLNVQEQRISSTQKLVVAQSLSKEDIESLKNSLMNSIKQTINDTGNVNIEIVALRKVINQAGAELTEIDYKITDSSGKKIIQYPSIDELVKGTLNINTTVNEHIQIVLENEKTHIYNYKDLFKFHLTSKIIHDDYKEMELSLKTYFKNHLQVADVDVKILSLIEKLDDTSRIVYEYCYKLNVNGIDISARSLNELTIAEIKIIFQNTKYVSEVYDAVDATKTLIEKKVLFKIVLQQNLLKVDFTKMETLLTNVWRKSKGENVVINVMVEELYYNEERNLVYVIFYKVTKNGLILRNYDYSSLNIDDLLKESELLDLLSFLDEPFTFVDFKFNNFISYSKTYTFHFRTPLLSKLKSELIDEIKNVIYTWKKNETEIEDINVELLQQSSLINVNDQSSGYTVRLFITVSTSVLDSDVDIFHAVEIQTIFSALKITAVSTYFDIIITNINNYVETDSLFYLFTETKIEDNQLPLVGNVITASFTNSYEIKIVIQDEIYIKKRNKFANAILFTVKNKASNVFIDVRKAEFRVPNLIEPFNKAAIKFTSSAYIYKAIELKSNFIKVKETKGIFISKEFVSEKSYSIIETALTNVYKMEKALEDCQVKIVSQDEYLSSSGETIIELLYKLHWTNKDTLAAEVYFSSFEIKTPDISAEFPVFKKPIDELFRYSRRFQFALKRYRLSEDDSKIQNEFGSFWNGKIGSAVSPFLVKQEEMLNLDGDSVYLSSYFLKKSSGDVLDGRLYDFLSQEDLKKILNVVISSTTPIDNYNLHILFNLTDLVRRKDVFFLSTIERISKMDYEKISNKLTEMWKSLRKSNVINVTILPISEKYVTKTAILSYRLFYKVTESYSSAAVDIGGGGSLLLASLIGQVEASVIKTNLGMISLSNGKTFVDLLFESQSENYRLTNAFSVQLSKGVISADKTLMENEFMKIFTAKYANVKSLTILNQEEYIDEDSLKSIFKLYYLVKLNDESIFDASKSINIDVSAALKLVKVSGTTDSYDSFIHTGRKLLAFSDLLYVTINQKIITNQFSNIKGILTRAWKTKSFPNEDVNVNIISQSDYTSAKNNEIVYNRLFYTLKVSNIIYIASDLMQLSETDLTPLLELKGNIGNYILVSSSVVLNRLAYARHFFINKPLKLIDIEVVSKNLLENIKNVKSDISGIKMSTGDQFIHESKGDIIRQSYYMEVEGVVINGQLEMQPDKVTLTSKLAQLNYTYIDNVEEYYNEEILGKLFIPGIISKSKAKNFQTSLQTIYSTKLAGSSVTIFANEEYLSQIGDTVTCIYYKISKNGEIQDGRSLEKLLTFESYTLYNSTGLIKYKNLYKLSLKGVITRPDSKAILESSDFAKIWKEKLPNVALKFIKSTINFGKKGLLITTILYTVRQDAEIYSPLTLESVNLNELAEAAKLQFKMAEFYNPEDIYLSDELFSINLIGDLSFEKISVVRDALAVVWKRILSDSTVEVVGILDAATNTDKLLHQIYYKVTTSLKVIRTLDQDEPNVPSIPQFEIYKDSLYIVKTIFLKGSFGVGYEDKLEQAFKLSWTQIGYNFNTKIVYQNSKTTDLNWSAIMHVKYIVETAQKIKEEPALSILNSNLNQFGFSECGCKALRHRELKLKNNRTSINIDKVSNAIKTAWLTKNNDVESKRFKVVVKFSKNTVKRAIGETVHQTLDGKPVTDISLQVMLDNFEPNEFFVNEPTTDELNLELARIGNTACNNDCQIRSCKWIDIIPELNDNDKDLILAAIEQAYVKKNPSVDSNDIDGEITQVEYKTAVDSSKFSKVSFCVWSNDGSILTDPIMEEFQKAILQVPPYKLIVDDVESTEPPDTIYEVSDSGIVAAIVVCIIISVIIMILVSVKVFVRSRRLKRHKIREADREYLHDEEFYPKPTFPKFNDKQSDYVIN